jgi:acyl-coenzyme A thioesterase PaaI-like protein
MVRHLKGSRLRRLINFWPPFLFAGIRSTNIDPDFRAIDVALVLRWFNRNYVGTHFGGSLFAMTDPWYMLMLMQNLGRDYYVWDQRSTIEFIAPGRGTVRAEFRIDEALLATIREHTAAGAKYLPEFTVDILDAEQKLVARVHKTIYIRKKARQPQSA